jgi:hypothetical protein
VQFKEAQNPSLRRRGNRTCDPLSAKKTVMSGPRCLSLPKDSKDNRPTGGLEEGLK